MCSLLQRPIPRGETPDETGARWSLGCLNKVPKIVALGLPILQTMLATVYATQWHETLRNLELMIWESDKNWRLEHKNQCCGWCRCRHMPWPAWQLRAYPLQPGFGSGKGLQLKTQKVLRFQHAHITNKSFLASWATTPGVTCSPTLFSYSLGEAPCCYPCCIDLLVAEPAADKLIWYDFMFFARNTSSMYLRYTNVCYNWCLHILFHP